MLKTAGIRTAEQRDVGYSGLRHEQNKRIGRSRVVGISESEYIDQSVMPESERPIKRRQKKQ